MIDLFLAQLPTVPNLEESQGLFTIMQRGGILMWFIAVGSVIAVAVFAERLLYYRRCRIRVAEFLSGIFNLVRRRKYIEALERCDEAEGPVVNVVRAGILRRDLPPAELREVVRENAQLELPKLEANVTILATTASIMPLLGLLGTVVGMIEAFTVISLSAGTAPVSELATGIWTALLTTAAGITVAIPCYVAYNYLVARLNDIIFDMERAAIEVVHVIGEPEEKDVIRLPEAGDTSREGTG